MSSLEFLVKTAIVCGRLVVLLPVVVHHTMEYYSVFLDNIDDEDEKQ